MKLYKVDGKFKLKKSEEPTEEPAESEKYSVDDCICEIVAYNGSLQVSHWKADTITNQHKALGDLYDSMIGLIDTFTETYIGKYGMIKLSICELEDLGNTPVAKGLEYVKKLQSNCKTGEDDDLLNIVADMSTALYKAKYLLKE